MKVVSECRRLFVLWLTFPLMAGLVWARKVEAAAEGGAAASRPANVISPVRQNAQHLSDGTQLNYVGVYPADGKFRPPSKLDKLRSERPWWTRGAQAENVRPVEVPPSIKLRSIERVIEDFEPPAHAMNAVRQRSALREGAHGLVRLLYGRENVLQAPTYLTTDSRGRLIITDPALPAVHVLDVEGEDSFRILAGSDRRLRRPAGAAVDGQDNIYVADAARAMIFVYRPDGSFIRRIGELEGVETLFHAPTAVAIDREAGHIYVLDRSRIMMLDMAGKVLKRVGRQRSAGVVPEFENPSDMALSKDALTVLDADGSRIQILDLDLNIRRKISVTLPPTTLPNSLQKPGLTVDGSGYIYVTCPMRSNVRVFRSDGTLVGDFGARGTDVAQFSSPAGIWVDQRNRIFIADRNNKRVQVFQINYSLPQAPAMPPARGR